MQTTSSRSPRDTANSLHKPAKTLALSVLLSLVALAANAQDLLPSTVIPDASWGGHVIEPQVPYQPTLPSEISPYPITNGVAPVYIDPNGVPFAAPEAFPDPLYPAKPQTLRESITPIDARDGFFQKARIQSSWIPQLQEDSLGWTDIKAEVITALPFFTRENPILITPSYTLHFLEAPQGIELPPRLNDVVVDFHTFRIFDDRWIADVAITPGLYTDDHSFDSSDALRWNGRALGIYAPNLRWKWVLGVTYVNGGWAKVVPVAGFAYEPHDDAIYEAVFPAPRAAWRLASSPIPGKDEYWFFILGEFASVAWAFQQSNGDPDVLAYRDFRAVLGFEHKKVGGISSKIELGWIFNRDIKVASISGDDISLADSLLLRGTLSY